MRLNKLLLPWVLCLSTCQILSAQPSDTTNRKRLKPLIIATSVGYAGALIGLNKVWYNDFKKEPFHFFNDSKEWKQMDKVGHFFSGFQLSLGGYETLQWAGVRERKAALWGILFSAAILTPIEVFDGFSEGYGASYTDLIANTTGAAFFYLQQSTWGELRIYPKFSFHRTNFPIHRPELLGNGLGEEILKDYNGQTYWLSFDLSKMLNGKFPKWLNLAVGYSATNMVAAHARQSQALGFDPYRQYFLAIDFDFHEYKTRSGVVNTLLYFASMIHLPAPALEFGKKLKFHLAYY